MLQAVLDTVGVDAEACANQLGISARVFATWASGQHSVPESVVPLLAAVFGVSASTIRSRSKGSNVRTDEIRPAIWYKFAGPEFTEVDRECIIAIRQIGHFLNELEEVTRNRAAQWRTLFESIRAETDLQASPPEQGRAAARMLREATSLGHGVRGIGEVMRGALRSMGVLVFEAPIKQSRLEGCSFYVGNQPAARPCVFSNTHHVTWFRRNTVLLHELGHAIFEAALSGASVDRLDATDRGNDPAELRADAFARECLVPRPVLEHVAQTSGLRWTNVTPQSLAALVAATHAEQKTVLDAAQDAGLLSPDTCRDLKRLDIADELRAQSRHALSTDEYLELVGVEAKEWVGKRTTTTTPHPYRLPVGYVKSVVDAYRDRQISVGKAAEYLMTDEAQVIERFGDESAAVEE